MSDDKTNAPVATPDAAPVANREDAPAAAPEAAKEEAAAAPVESKVAESDAAPAPAPAPEETQAKSDDKSAQDKPENPSEPPADDLDVAMTDAPEAGKTPAADVEMKDEASEPDQVEASAPAAAADAPVPATTPKPNKAKGGRKSVGASEGKGKKLNRKASKAKILHTDAEPGQHYFVKLKGFPQWPVVICDEDMLPAQLLKTRPVSAKRADGTYRDDYADDAKKVVDRTFPVMYLHTNEFGWVHNAELIDLDPDTVQDAKTEKMRKDLQAAHDLAAENNDLDFYKGVLQQFQEDLIEQEKTKAAKAAATPKSKKSKAVAAVDEDDDVDMAEAGEDEDEQPIVKEKKPKKRKAEEAAETPQRSESVKKPKIKLTTNSTPKPANGTTPTPSKAAKSVADKTAKAKAKKPKETEEKKVVEEKVATPKEPELSPEEKHVRKEKEVLFLRHKLQKGLLSRDQVPKEEEMKSMSDFLAKLESLADLEVSVIKATKINKVLKAILKLDSASIPKEDEFQFKSRSQALLDKWNKLLAADAPAAGESAPAAAPAAANGVNGTTKVVVSLSKDEAAVANGVQPQAEDDAAAKTTKDDEVVKDAEEEKESESKKSDQASEKADKTDAGAEEQVADDGPATAAAESVETTA